MMGMSKVQLTQYIDVQHQHQNITHKTIRSILDNNNNNNNTRACYKYWLSHQQIMNIYGRISPNSAIHHLILHILTIFILITCIVIALPLLILNLYASTVQLYWYQQITIFNALTNNTILNIQIYIWVSLSLVLSCFTLWIRIYIIKCYRQLNNGFDSQGDYGIIVRGLPPGTSDEVLKGYIDTEIGVRIVERKLERGMGKRQDVQLEVKDLLRNRQIIRPKQTKNINRKISQFQKLLKNMSKQQRFQFLQKPKTKKLLTKIDFEGQKNINIALITFYRIDTNDQIHQTMKEMQKIWRWMPIPIKYCRPRASRCMLDGAPVLITRAPEPNDILWDNLSYDFKEKVGRSVIFSIACLGLIVLSGYLSYVMYQVSHGSGVVAGLFTALMLSINKVFALLLEWFISQKKLHTYTFVICNRLYFRVMFESLNLGIFNLLIPFFSEYPNIKAGIEKTNFSILLPTTMLIELAQIIAIYFIQIYTVKSKFYKWLLKNNFVKLNLLEMQRQLSGQEVPFDVLHSKWIKYVWYGLIFGIISPISIFISAFFFIIYCYTEVNLFQKVYLVPKLTGIQVPLSFVNLLQNASILISLVNLGIHYGVQQVKGQPMDVGKMVLLVVILVFSCVFGMFPWDQILEFLSINILSDPTLKYDQRMQHFNITYSISNPAIFKVNNKNQLTNQKVEQMNKGCYFSEQLEQDPRTQRPLSSKKTIKASTNMETRYSL